MKRYAITALGLVMAFEATASFAKETEVTEREIAVPKCERPAAKIMFSEFKCKAADCAASGSRQEPGNSSWWNPGSSNQPSYQGVGTGLSDMLATALTQTGCFEVMERGALDEVQKELALVGKKAKVEAADYMISGSITSLGFDTRATNLGGLGFAVPILGGVSYKTTKAHLNMDVRLIDIDKAKILASKTFEGNNQKTGFGVGAVGVVPGAILGGNHAAISGTPLEEVARDVLVRATVYITEKLAKNNITERVALKGGEEKTRGEKSGLSSILGD